MSKQLILFVIEPNGPKDCGTCGYYDFGDYCDLFSRALDMNRKDDDSERATDCLNAESALAELVAGAMQHAVDIMYDDGPVDGGAQRWTETARHYVQSQIDKAKP